MSITRAFFSKRKSQFLSERHVLLFIVVLVAYILVGCERQAGDVVSIEKTSMGPMEFLAVRNTIKYYRGEIARSYWCRSPATKSGSKLSREHDAFWDARPSVEDNADYRFFGTIGERINLPSSSSPTFSDLRLVGNQAVYSTSYLVVTFDSCLTRTYFNVKPHPRLAESMLGLPIDYPDNNLQPVPPFFESLELHEGGGCFRINSSYTRSAQKFFYCTVNNGKTWVVESPRGTRVIPLAEDVEREKTIRENANKIVWCPQAHGLSGASLRKGDCEKQSGGN